MFRSKMSSRFTILGDCWKNILNVIPNGVCEVRNLSFLLLMEEGFLAALGMTC
jgi:hypothetical protein